MKKHLSTIGFNLLKVLGAAWVGFLISFIPLYIIRFSSVPINTENILLGIIGGIGTTVTLFVFFKWEGRKREFRTANPKELAMYSITPTLIWALIGSLFKSNPFLILTNTASFCMGITGIDRISECAFFQPFPYALLFSAFYSAAIFGGYMYGRKFNDL